jgi:hypothetical protein
MSYIILKGRWCDIIVPNVHEPTEDNIDDMKDSFYNKPERVFDKFPKYHMKFLLEFNAEVGMEDIFNQTISNESLHEISNDNGESNKLCHIQKSDCQKYNCKSKVVPVLNYLSNTP